MRVVIVCVLATLAACADQPAPRLSQLAMAAEAGTLTADEARELDAIVATWHIPGEVHGAERAPLVSPCAEGGTTYWCGASGGGCSYTFLPGSGQVLAYNEYVAFVCDSGWNSCQCFD
jgi:hypothetical protein